MAGKTLYMAGRTHYIWQGGHYVWQGGHYIWQRDIIYGREDHGGERGRLRAMGVRAVG